MGFTDGGLADGDLADALAGVLRLEADDDGALTVRHDGTVASLRTVTVADGLEMVSLTQVLAAQADFSGSRSSESRPTWLRRASSASKDSRACSRRPVRASASTRQKAHTLNAVSGLPKSSRPS